MKEKEIVFRLENLTIHDEFLAGLYIMLVQTALSCLLSLRPRTAASYSTFVLLLDGNVRRRVCQLLPLWIVYNNELAACAGLSRGDYLKSIDAFRPVDALVDNRLFGANNFFVQFRAHTIDG